MHSGRDSEYRSNRVMLLIRNEMPISTDHFFGLVSHPRIDGPLIHALSRTIRREAVSQNMPAA